MKELYQTYKNLIYRIAWSFHRTTGVDVEDLIGEANLHFVRACESKNNKYAKFSTYLYRFLENELSNYVKKENTWNFPQNDVDLLEENDPEAILSASEIFNALSDVAKDGIDALMNEVDAGSRGGVFSNLSYALKNRGHQWKRIEPAIKELRHIDKQSV